MGGGARSLKFRGGSAEVLNLQSQPPKRVFRHARTSFCKFNSQGGGDSENQLTERIVNRLKCLCFELCLSWRK